MAATHLDFFFWFWHEPDQGRGKEKNDRDALLTLLYREGVDVAEILRNL